MEKKEKLGTACALTRILKIEDDVIWYCSKFLGECVFFVCCRFLVLLHSMYHFLCRPISPPSLLPLYFFLFL